MTILLIFEIIIEEVNHNNKVYENLHYLSHHPVIEKEKGHNKNMDSI